MMIQTLHNILARRETKSQMSSVMKTFRSVKEGRNPLSHLHQHPG